jgi:hypothetical protein
MTRAQKGAARHEQGARIGANKSCGHNLAQKEAKYEEKSFETKAEATVS